MSNILTTETAVMYAVEWQKSNGEWAVDRQTSSLDQARADAAAITADEGTAARVVKKTTTITREVIA